MSDYALITLNVMILLICLILLGAVCMQVLGRMAKEEWEIRQLRQAKRAQRARRFAGNLDIQRSCKSSRSGQSPFHL